MNSELIKNIDALVVNYISLKTFKQEEIHKNNPIAKYYNDNIMSNQIKNMNKFMESLLHKKIDDIQIDDMDDNNLFNINNFDNDLYEKLFTSNSDVEITDITIQNILEYSYKLYIDLDDINASSDKNILPIVDMLFGNEINKDEIIDRLKYDFIKSFLFIINNTNINNENINHIKHRLILKELDEAIKKEDYLKAAELKNKIDKIKKDFK